MNLEDQELIKACLDGQTEAFGQLVVRYQNRLFHALVHIMGSADDAQDVAQDAFVLAFQKLGTFQGNSAFYSWLFRIAVNASVSYRRKSRRTPASLDAIREQSGDEPTDLHPDTEPSRPIDSSERQALVRSALSALSAEYRTVLVLKEMEDLSYEEIAAVVGCPIGTVRSRIHRARQELRCKLARLLGDDAS